MIQYVNWFSYDTTVFNRCGTFSSLDGIPIQKKLKLNVLIAFGNWTSWLIWQKPKQKLLEMQHWQEQPLLENHAWNQSNFSENLPLFVFHHWFQCFVLHLHIVKPPIHINSKLLDLPNCTTSTTLEFSVNNIFKLSIYFYA